MTTNIPRSFFSDQFPNNNHIDIKVGDDFTYVTYKNPDPEYVCDYIYWHERVGKVLEIYPDRTFKATMWSISGNVSMEHIFTLKELNKCIHSKQFAYLLVNITKR